MLHGIRQIWNLTLSSNASELPNELTALGKTSGTQRMTFADQTTRWIDDALATIRVLACVNPFSCFSFLAQPQSLVSDKFVGTKTIVEFYNTDLFWFYASLFECYVL